MGAFYAFKHIGLELLEKLKYNIDLVIYSDAEVDVDTCFHNNVMDRTSKSAE